MINNSFKNNDDYIVLARIKKFCKDNNIGTIYLKEEGLKKIEEFASISENHKLIVNQWLDMVIKEGRKYSLLKKN